MKSILLVGGGGHCISCIEAIESSQNWSIFGIVDASISPGTAILGYEVLGSDRILQELYAIVPRALVAVGHLGNSDVRRKLWMMLGAVGFAMPVVLAGGTQVSQHAALGSGTIVMKSAVINAAAKIGLNCIVNTGAIVEHGVTIGDNCHISTGAIVNGDCQIGDGCFVGSGAVLRQGIRIAPNTVVGAGTVVIRDIPNSGKYAGNPARRIDA